MACVLFNPVVVGASLLYQKNEQLKNFQIYVDNSSIQVKIYTALSTDHDVDFQGRSSRSSEVRHLFAKIPVFVPRPANEFKYLPQFSGAKQKMSVVARCVF